MHLTKYSLAESIYDNNTNSALVLLLNTKNGIQLAINEYTYRSIENAQLNLLPKELLDLLHRHDFLTELSPEQELAQIISENQEEDNKNDILHIVLQPSSWCQLGCSYCGQAHTKNGSLNKDLTVSFIEKKLVHHKPKNLAISWFGSEPLTSVDTILAIAQEVKSLCKTKGVELSSKMVTNGVNLTLKNVQLLAEQANCNKFEVTLDGTAEYHDKRRHTKYKGKSFDVIYKNILQILKSDNNKTQISIRCNVDFENREGVLPLIQKMHADGLHKKIAYFYTVPVHSWGNEAHLRSSSLQNFAEWEMGILVDMIRLDFQTTLIPKRSKQLCLSSLKSGYLVDPKGEVFGCTEVSMVASYEKDGQNIHRLGNIADDAAGEIQNINKFSDFYSEIKKGKYACGDCFLLPMCGGRCPKEWAEGRAACPPLKINIKEKMILRYLLGKKYLPHQRNTNQKLQEINPVL